MEYEELSLNRLSGTFQDSGRLRMINRKQNEPGAKAAPATRSRYDIESGVTQAALRLLRETLGRGPTSARTYLVDMMLIMRFTVPLQPPEQALIKHDAVEGLKAVRAWRMALLKACADGLAPQINALAGVPCRTILADFCGKTDEAVFAVLLDAKPALRPAEGGEPRSQETQKEVPVP
jgi:uncharacterized protein YbcI